MSCLGSPLSLARLNDSNADLSSTEASTCLHLPTLRDLESCDGIEDVNVSRSVNCIHYRFQVLRHNGGIFEHQRQ
jgi:hypothetical protein